MSKSSPKKVNTTTTVAPPEYLQGPLQDAAMAAQLEYQQGGGYNPYTDLDLQFNRAADITRTRLDSEFAGSGRNLGASYPARSDELQGLAARFYDPQNVSYFDPTNTYIRRLGALSAPSGSVTNAQQPFYRTGLF
jgi:hypothetical protein